MRKRKRRCKLLSGSTAVLACLLLSVQRAARADDAFEDAYCVAQESNPPGLTFALRLAGGKTSFRQGEAVQITAAFSSDRPGLWFDPFLQPGRGWVSFGRFIAAPQDPANRAAVVDPLYDMPLQGGFAYEGPLPPQPFELSAKPYQITLSLSDWLRFDRPGTYRIYAQVWRVHGEKPKTANGFVSDAKPCVSNLLEIQVTPVAADPEQAQRQQTEAIIERMGRNVGPRSSDDDTWELQPKLVGFRDRDAVIRQMRLALSRPDYAVTQGMMETLALLEALRRFPRPRDGGSATVTAASLIDLEDSSRRPPAEEKRASHIWDAQEQFVLQEWCRVADEVAHKTKRQRAMTLHTLLELAWINPGLVGKPGATALRSRVPRLKAQLIPIFDQLPELPLKYFLDSREWTLIRDPGLLPALLRLWNKPPLEEEWPPSSHSAVLQRIYELAPATGRRLILTEIRYPMRGVDVETLSLLRERTLPGLDHLLLARLENPKTSSDNFEAVCALIERYASASILGGVKKVYGTPDGSWSCAPQTALLAYFLRVAPDYGAGLIAKVMWQRRNTGCYTDVLNEVGRLHFDKRLIRLAQAHLHDPNRQVAANVRRFLTLHKIPIVERQTPIQNRAKAVQPKPTTS